METRGTAPFTYDGGSNNLAGDGTSGYNRTPEGALLSVATGDSRLSPTRTRIWSPV
ncbi:hypothetical protein [Streptomyces sp. NPDC086787]|uniref:hypothetical protein n=1 Tax=Streptomyces sp. NPDC086787 TaxID=3365759 RepID=UPI00381B490B